MKRYKELLQLSKTHPKDVERLALFHILAHNDDLYTKAAKIYNFTEGSIKTNCLGYTNWEIEENLNMGEEWSIRCAICQSPLEEDETYTCDVCNDIPDLCTSSKKLVQLAFNWFNGSELEALYREDGISSMQDDMKMLQDTNVKRDSS